MKDDEGLEDAIERIVEPFVERKRKTKNAKVCQHGARSCV